MKSCKKLYVMFCVSVICMAGISSQSSFASEQSDFQIRAASSVSTPDGRFGVMEVDKNNRTVRNPSLSIAGGSEIVRINTDVFDGSGIIGYAAFSSRKEASIGFLDLPQYTPWVFSGKTYLYMAIRVTAPTDTITVDWHLHLHNSMEVHEDAHNDFIAPSGGQFLPQFWYFFWWSPDVDLAQGLWEMETNASIETEEDPFHAHAHAHCLFEMEPDPDEPPPPPPHHDDGVE